jgi:sugar lactone lactonase YvrE
MGVCPLISPDGGAPPAVGDNACLAVDALNVYWANGKVTPSGAVYKVPVNGGKPTLVKDTLDNPHGIATDGIDVFWANIGSGEIWKADGAGVTTPAPIVTGQSKPVDIVTTALGIVWLNSGDGSIYSSDKNGGNVTQIIAGVDGGVHTGHLRVAGSTVYWTDTAAGTIHSAPIMQNATATLVASPAVARYLDLDPKLIFFSSGSGATSDIATTPLAGTTITPIELNQAASAGVALDTLHLYWANAGTSMNTGTINRAKKDGTNATQLATGQNFPGCIALDALSIYWINDGGGAISKTGK